MTAVLSLSHQRMQNHGKNSFQRSLDRYAVHVLFLSCLIIYHWTETFLKHLFIKHALFWLLFIHTSLLYNPTTNDYKQWSQATDEQFFMTPLNLPRPVNLEIGYRNVSHGWDCMKSNLTCRSKGKSCDENQKQAERQTPNITDYNTQTTENYS